MNAEGELVTNAFIKNGDKYYWVNKDGRYTKTYTQKATQGYMIYDQATGRPLI